MKGLQTVIRAIPDFPKPGIIFRDITPLLRDPAMLRLTVKQLVEPFVDESISAVAGIEARGFIFGSLAAWELGCGFVPLRKPGKLPATTRSKSYDLEYGSTSLEIHTDALQPGDRVLLVDDVIATGGTARASCALIEQSGATVIGCAFVIELDALGGRAALKGQRVHTLLHY